MAKREEVGERSGGTMKVKKLVIDDEDLIPREYLVINEVLLRKTLLEGMHVPGAHIEEVLSVTSK
jgi:hypothetical protein